MINAKYLYPYSCKQIEMVKCPLETAKCLIQTQQKITSLQFIQ